MQILNVICETSFFLRIIYYVEIVRKILFIILPIGLIIMLTVKALKNVIHTNNDWQTELKSVSRKIIAAVIVMLVPVLVNIIILFTGYDIKDTYNTCRNNATIDKIEYYENIEEKVQNVEELINFAKNIPTIENLTKAEIAVSELYGVANGSIIEDLEYSLAEIRTKITMTDDEFKCKAGGGVYIDSKCTYKSPTSASDSNNNSSGMVYYTYKKTNDYLVVNTKLSVSEYVKYIQSHKICQSQKGFRYGDQCLCFAEEHTHALMTGDTHKKASDVNEYYYSAYFNKYSNDDKSKILNMIYSELISNKPVILQVNGNKNGTTRHYVTVIGFKSTVTSASNLKETDILLIDSDDAKVEQLHTWGKSRFMTTGAKCNKKYTGYQVYMIVEN